MQNCWIRFDGHHQYIKKCIEFRLKIFMTCWSISILIQSISQQLSVPNMTKLTFFIMQQHCSISSTIVGKSCAILDLRFFLATFLFCLSLYPLPRQPVICWGCIRLKCWNSKSISKENVGFEQNACLDMPACEKKLYCI